jgi:hypothetical protein
MRTCRKITEPRHRNAFPAVGLHVVLGRPCARIEFVIERIVIRTREIRPHYEIHIVRLLQHERNLHLACGSVRRRTEALVAAIVRPLDVLSVQRHLVVLHHEGREQTLA